MCSSRGGAEIELRFPDSEAGSTFCSVSSHASVVLCSEQCTRMDLVAVQASQHTCAQCWAPEPTTHPCRDQGRIVPDCPHGLKLQINMTQRGCLCLRISVQVASAEGRRQHRGHLHRTQSGGVRGHRDDCVKFCSEASAKDGVGGLEVQLEELHSDMGRRLAGGEWCLCASHWPRGLGQDGVLSPCCSGSPGCAVQLAVSGSERALLPPW